MIDSDPHKPKNNLLVVAHPDDETVFFGGLLLAGAGPRCDIVCVTDGNHEGRGAVRKALFHEACAQLGARSTAWLGYQDSPNLQLPMDELIEDLARIGAKREYDRIYTHSPHGDYGHFNHMDVSLAVHRVFCGKVSVYSVAYALYADLRVNLTREQYEKKMEILSSIYFDDFAGLWPRMQLIPYEGFIEISLAEAEKIYGYCMHGDELTLDDTDRYRPLFNFLTQTRKK